MRGGANLPAQGLCTSNCSCDFLAVLGLLTEFEDFLLLLWASAEEERRLFFCFSLLSEVAKWPLTCRWRIFWK